MWYHRFCKVCVDPTARFIRPLGELDALSRLATGSLIRLIRLIHLPEILKTPFDVTFTGLH